MSLSIGDRVRIRPNMPVYRYKSPDRIGTVVRLSRYGNPPNTDVAWVRWDGNKGSVCIAKRFLIGAIVATTGGGDG